MAELKALTFDLWDTIVADDSDEPKRSAAGLGTKLQDRRRILWEAIQHSEPIDRELVTTAYDVADAAFNRVWHDQFVTWTIAERLDVILRGIRRTLPPQTLAEVIAAHESMEVDIPPDLIEGCHQALQALSARYRLAIVSDAIVTPGRRLRDLLELYGVKQFFQGFAFSDEVGHSKPHRAMFESAAEQLGVALEEMAHVGDREHNDIRGPHALGMRAILFTATRNVDAPGNTADAACERYADLPGIVDRLAGRL